MVFEARTFAVVIPLMCYVFGTGRIPKGCNIKPSMDKCGSTVPRWFYNASSQTCQPVLWKRCGYKGNLFKTHSDCEQGCGRSYKSVDDHCLKFPRGQYRNHSKGSTSMWSFHFESGTCVATYYDGLSGSKNFYSTCKICSKKCLRHTLQRQTSPDRRPKRHPSLRI
uniref:Pancreatic trypsin inhibitor n=1 Tax=Rhipicephalus zambeziensis TaxID=60191 RepID=A0A224YBF6_9ACAR